MKKAATLLGCVAGVCIQVGLLYGYSYIFVLLSYPALLTLGQLFAFIFQTGKAIGFHVPLTYLLLIHSASIPVFYALTGFVIGHLLKSRRG
jgi:hypothetical protein